MAVANSIIGIVVFACGFGVRSISLWIGFSAMAAGVLLVILVMDRSLLWRRAFRDCKKCTEDIAVTFGEDNVHVENAEGVSDLKWGFFSWYLDAADHVLLCMTKDAFSVIPKSAFLDQAAIDQFLALLASKLEKIR